MLDCVIYVWVADNQIDRMHQLQTSKVYDVFMILIYESTECNFKQI